MILVIDNYDSFTFNLVQMVRAAGAEVEVVRNDAAPVAELLAKRPRGFLLSPGPKRPEDAGVCLDLYRAEPRVPVLGVCLGHQALAVAYGGRVDRAERLMHGKSSPVRHDGSGILAGLPDPFEAARYHSLDVKPGSLPEVLRPTAWSLDGALMAMEHRTRPYFGVQFHPESVLTAAGPRLIDNFLALCGETGGAPRAAAREEA